MNKLARLEVLNPEAVFSFLEKGKSNSIDKEMQEYIYHLQWAAEIWNTERNTTRAAQKLRVRIMAQHKKKLTIHTCLSRLFDSLNYFNVDNNVSQEIWDRDYANKFEDLAKLAIAQDKLIVAKQCYKEASTCRARANSALNPDDLKAPLFLVSPRISAEDLGFKSEKLLAITQKANEGFYAKMISDLPLEKQEKLRLLSDAGIEDVEFEDVEG
ncbi:MAG: hypothetical protein V2B15_08630 [Bacteroidota bacterium]